MRSKYLLFLLAAGVVLSLTGCEKEPNEQSGEPKEVCFAVATANPQTKTEYTGEGTEGTGGLAWERINWVKGDPLLIWSDNAVDRVNQTAHVAHYSVGDPKETDVAGNYPNQSWSIVKDDSDWGLIFKDGVSTFNFWSIYPASAALEPAPTGGSATSNTVSFLIKDTQTGEKDASVTDKSLVKPDMKQAVMLAAASSGYNEDVILKYYPAFTAFEFTLATVAGEKELSKVVLSSSSVLAGTVNATVLEGTRTNDPIGNVIGASTYEIASEDSEDDTTEGDSTDDGELNTITFNLPPSTKVTPTNMLTFTVFAVPQDIEGLKVSFYTADEDLFIADLRNNNEAITFAAAKKHRLFGIALPDGRWHVYLDSEVQEWEDAINTVTYGNSGTDGIIISAGALEHISGAEDHWSRTATTLDSSTSVLSAYYSVYSPTNGKWRITMKGEDASYFTLESVSANEGTDSADGDGEYVEGDVHQRVFFTLTPKAGASGKSVELWFTVVMGEGEDEVEYTLHSEVTRSSLPLTVTCP